MLCGEVARRDEVVRRLQTERAAIVERIQALDSTMEMFAPQLNPGAAGAVRATAGRYGPRGGLTSFLLEQVMSAGENGVDTRTLRERAAVRFAVDVGEHPNFASFRDTIGWSLRFLERKGLIAGIAASKGGHRPKVWRAVNGPTFANLLAQQETVDDQDPDSP